MKKKILASVALLLGSSIAIMAVCFVDYNANCPASVSVSGQTGCTLWPGPTTYPSVKEGDGWTSSYADTNTYCHYICDSG